MIAHHVAMSVKSFDARKQLLVVSQRDEDLGVVADRLLEDGQRALRDFVLLQLPELGLIEL